MTNIPGPPPPPENTPSAESAPPPPPSSGPELPAPPTLSEGSPATPPEGQGTPPPVQGEGSPVAPSVESAPQFAPGYATGPVPTAPAGPGLLPSTFSVWARTVGNIFTGKPELAYAPGAHPQFAAPGTPLFWLLSSLIYGVIAGLLLMPALKPLAILGTGGLYSYSSVEIPAASYILFFLLSLFLSVVFVALRGLCLMAAFAMRGRKIGFTGAANLAGLGFIAALPMPLVTMLVMLAPNVVTVALVMLVGAFCVYLGEVAIYVASSKWARFEKSAMMPFALMTVAWLFACSLFMFIFVQVMS